MSFVIDLQDLSTPSEKEDGWRKAVRDWYYSVDIKFKHGQDPAGKISLSRIGDVDISTVISVAQYHERRPETDTTQFGRLLAVVQLQGDLILNQYGRERTVRPGELAVCDPSMAYEAVLPGDHRSLLLQVPRLRFDRALGHASGYANQVIGESQGSRILASYFRDMAESFEMLCSEKRARMASFGVDILIDTLSHELGLRPATGTDQERPLLL